MLGGDLLNESGEVLSKRIVNGEVDVCWAGACRGAVLP